MKQMAWIGTFGSSLHVEVICAGVESAIKAAAFDAVVLDSDTSLSTAEASSGRLLNLAGSAAVDQARALLPLGIGDVAVTVGGHLPVRHILHAVTVDHARNLFSTERTIRQTTRRILTRCEALQIRRLAMPAIGAEFGRLDAVASTRSILAVLREHARFVTVLEHVFILVPDRAVFVAVLQHLQSGAAAPWRLDEPTTGEAEPAPPRPQPPIARHPPHSVPIFWRGRAAGGDGRHSHSHALGRYSRSHSKRTRKETAHGGGTGARSHNRSNNAVSTSVDSALRLT